MKKRISNLMFLIATVIWGFAFVAQKEATTIPAFTVGAVRSIMAMLFLSAMIPLTDKLTNSKRGAAEGKRNIPFNLNKRELIGGSILGVLIVAASGVQQMGIEDTDAGKAAFITALYVVIVPIMSAFLGKKPHLNAIISVPVAVLGFYFLCLGPSVTLQPSDLLLLLCALIFSVHIIVVDRFSPDCDGMRISFVQFVVASILNTAIALIFEGPVEIEPILQGFGPLLYLGILSSGVGYTLQILAQKDADPTVSSVFLSLESVFGVIGGALILGEKMSLREYIGCAIVFAAIIISQFDFIEFIKKLKTKQKDN
jgi:drug/metabolite transporter (DMT)-like permease